MLGGKGYDKSTDLIYGDMRGLACLWKDGSRVPEDEPGVPGLRRHGGTEERCQTINSPFRYRFLDLSPVISKGMFGTVTSISLIL